MRAFALLLGVAYHATLTFVPDVPAGVYAPVVDDSRSVALAVIAFTTHSFRMSLFFLLADFFGRLMIRRKGPLAFSIDRTRRILIPLVIGWLVLIPLLHFASRSPQFTSLENAAAFFSSLSLSQFPLGYLWFLYYLLILYGLALLLRGSLIVIDRKVPLVAFQDTALRTAVQRQWVLPLMLGSVYGVGLLMRNGWNVVDGIPTPNDALIPEKIPLALYGISFALGWAFHRQAVLLHAWGRRWRALLVGAIMATTTSILMVTLHEMEVFIRYDALERGAFAIAYGTASWCWTLGIIGFALSKLSSPSNVRRYFADSSYWIYLVHYPIVIALQTALATLPLHWALKYAIILAITFSLCVLTYHFLVRYTEVGRILNGRRYIREHGGGLRGPGPRAPTSGL